MQVVEVGIVEDIMEEEVLNANHLFLFLITYRRNGFNPFLALLSLEYFIEDLMLQIKNYI